ncbi:class I SAM-dependent methyltransferase [Roseomonas sp. BN140053]|uniref:class I SAM-dependent methyltransferase n=1 Tax=Roseomonas sp. BN140053 TaxID=3391898 RepID=UPI0039EA7691
MDLKEQEILGEGIGRHWYYRSKLAALRRWTAGLAAREVLDVGAGSGFFSRALLEGSGIRGATCVDPGYAADTDTAASGKPLRFRREVAASDADLVLMMDVLEHVDDDVGLLREYSGKVPAGTRFVVTVPAFQWLWSGHDVFLEHRRRYTLPQAERAVRAAGLTVERGAYFFGSVFPLAMAMRLPEMLRFGRHPPARSQMRQHGAVMNTLLSTACRAELPAFPFNRMGGLSVFVQARTP